MFCPKCGSLLIPRQEKDKITMACNCGYSDAKGKVHVKDQLRKKKDIEAVEEIEVYPVVDATCPKCSHPRAYFWEIQTRASDEPATKFMKCEKCKTIWRDYV